MVMLTCKDECEFIFYSYWSDIEVLGFEDTSKFIFGDRGRMQEYHITLPDK